MAQGKEDGEGKDYELSENQQLFVDDAESQGYEVDYDYSGRGMFGKRCPSVDLNRGERLVTHAKYSEDSLGLGTVVYATR